jgi:hypothetical protein
MKYFWIVVWGLICGSFISANAQWSTSTSARDGLFVCAGFNQALRTFPDGSSLVSGTLSSYVFLQKLDANGYPLWSSPVMAMQNDSADIFSPAGIIDDGNGGAFLIWTDHRDAILGANGYLNAGLQGQHVDRSGRLLWPQGGVPLIPSSRFPSSTCILPDNLGGLLLLEIDEVDSGFPATYVTRMSVSRLNPEGRRDWEIPIDSSHTHAFTAYSGGLAGQDMFVTVRRRGIYETLIFDTLSGAFRFEVGYSCFLSSRDSLLFRARLTTEESFEISRYGTQGQLDWKTSVTHERDCLGLAPFRYFSELLMSDFSKGAFFTFCCGDTIFHVDSLGTVNRPVFPGLSTLGGTYAFSDGHGGIVAISDTSLIAQRWNNGGQILWPPSFRTITDKQELYSPSFGGDNNGGILFAYWTTLGGIRIQHTGRTGHVGVLTSVASREMSQDGFDLCQNYPNPFNPTTTIRLRLSREARVSFAVYDIIGCEVLRVEPREFTHGEHAIEVNLPNTPSGVYFGRVTIDQHSRTLRMILLK